MRRVYISAFGSGLGHATRMISVAKALQGNGCQVRFSSSGEITNYLLRSGFSCDDIPLTDVVYTDRGSFSAKETLKFTPVVFARFIQQIGTEVGNLARFGPDAVLSDSVLGTVVAGRILGRKVVTVLNQLKLESSPGTPAIARKLLSTGSITVSNEFWELSDSILLPDLPPPYTISERNIWGAGSIGRRAKYVGFLTPSEDPTGDALTEKLRKETRKKLFWQISGPPKTRASLLAKAMALAKESSDRYVSIISAGDPRGSSSASPIPGGFLYEWCPVKDALISLCDFVVSRAGHTSIAQFIQAKKPALLIPIASHSEQQGNALKAQKLGISVLLQEADLGAGHYSEALALLNEESVRRRLEEVCAVADRFDALQTIVKETIS